MLSVGVAPEQRRSSGESKEGTAHTGRNELRFCLNSTTFAKSLFFVNVCVPFFVGIPICRGATRKYFVINRSGIESSEKQAVSAIQARMQVSRFLLCTSSELIHENFGFERFRPSF